MKRLQKILVDASTYLGGSGHSLSFERLENSERSYRVSNSNNSIDISEYTKVCKRKKPQKQPWINKNIELLSNGRYV